MEPSWWCLVIFEQEHCIGLIVQMIDTISDNGRVGLADATAFPPLANDTCGAVRRGEDALDFTTATFGAAMRALPELTPVGGHNIQG